MNNYEYIVASLPVLKPDARTLAGDEASELIAEIRSQLSPADTALLDTLLDSRRSECMTPEFYAGALKSPSRFLREYLAFDLELRNAKAAWLNRAFSRSALQDVILLDEDGQIEPRPEIERVLSESDILARERGLDELCWTKIDELTVFDYFDADAILGFMAKLLIVDRWLKLDEQTGRELFRRLVEQMRQDAPELKFEA